MKASLCHLAQRGPHSQKTAQQAPIPKMSCLRLPPRVRKPPAGADRSRLVEGDCSPHKPVLDPDGGRGKGMVKLFSINIRQPEVIRIRVKAEQDAKVLNLLGVER